MIKREDLVLVWMEKNRGRLELEKDSSRHSKTFYLSFLIRRVEKALLKSPEKRLPVDVLVESAESVSALNSGRHLEVWMRGTLEAPKESPGEIDVRKIRAEIEASAERGREGPTHEDRPRGRQNRGHTPAGGGGERSPRHGGGRNRAQRPIDPKHQEAIHRNPYNFAEFVGDGPWANPFPADPVVTFERFHNGSTDGEARRFSGRIGLTLRAASPVSVHVQLRDQAGMLRVALPGSSMKGAVRSVFEALTNSRMGVYEKERYDLPIPYRRRSAQAWVVEGEEPNGDLKVRKFRVAFGELRGNDFWRFDKRNRSWEQLETVPSAQQLRGSKADPSLDLQTILYRANLFWVPVRQHKHRHTHLLLGKLEDSATIRKEQVERYRRNLRHESFANHLDSVANLKAAPPMYKDPYFMPPGVREGRTTKAQEELANLSSGTVLFGILDATGRELACFGKNVNFLWPSAHSVGELVGDFYPRNEGAALQDPNRHPDPKADMAERVFGFAGVKKKGGHPQRGRVRCTTFWGPSPDDPEFGRLELTLKDLLSPKTRAKARHLYLKPGQGGRSASYDDGQNGGQNGHRAPDLRGRKFYWHQQGPRSGQLPRAHRLAAGSGGAREESGRFEVIPAGAELCGEVYFEDLRAEELGALLICLRPSWLDGGPQDDSRYALHVGKGKPRGCGSLTVTALTLERRDTEFLELEAEPQVEGGLEERMVRLFRAWFEAPARAGQPFERAAVIRDLRALHRLPRGEWECDYPTFKEAAWLPAFDDRDGEPTVGRPAAMGLARDLEGK